MKKMLYVNLDFKNYKNKTLAQLKAFDKARYSTSIFTIEDNKIILYETSNGEIKNRIEFSTIPYHKKQKIRYYHFVSDSICKIIDENKLDFIYIRRIGINIIFLELKKIHKKTKVVYELPTYPFDKTHSIKSNIIQMFEDVYLKQKGKKYIDIFPIILQSDAKLLNNMIPISNGIDIDNFLISGREKRKVEENKLNLVGIAHLNNWHGYDRILNTILIEKNLNITFTIYSNDTLELKVLKKFVIDNKLEKKVFFKKYDDHLDWVKEINKFDIAVGGIGYHRRNAIYDTSIKNKEYCALAIPFIIACKDLSFEDGFKYLYQISATDDNIDLKKIYYWYMDISNDDYITYMYNYAKNNLSFDYSIKKIIDELEKR